MDTIRNKIFGLHKETDTAVSKAAKMEKDSVLANKRAEAAELKQRELLKKISHKENELDNMLEELAKTEAKIAEKTKLLEEAEEDACAYERAVVLKEKELHKCEANLETTATSLGATSAVADESERKRKELEHRAMNNEDIIDKLESKLREAKFLENDATQKQVEGERKLSMLNRHLDRALNRADKSEDRIIELDDNLKIVGNKMKNMELAEEKSGFREDNLKANIRHLSLRLKEADSRADAGEMLVQKLHMRIDQLEDETVYFKTKAKTIKDELNQTFDDMIKIY